MSDKFPMPVDAPSPPRNARPSTPPSPISVLLVDDHADLVTNVFAWLEGRNYILDAAPDGLSGLELGLAGSYDVLVLDWMLPRLDGLAVLRRLREAGSDIPVLMLTARTELSDKLASFGTGADDYLTKPFSIAELEARILALHARRVGRRRVLRVADLCYDLSTHEITRNGQRLHLHPGSRKLLEVLMRESPGIVGKERLEAALWGDDLPDRDLLRTHIYELRKRIDAGHAAKLLHTIPKLGYRLLAPTAGASE